MIGVSTDFDNLRSALIVGNSSSIKISSGRQRVARSIATCPFSASSTSNPFKRSTELRRQTSPSSRPTTITVGTRAAPVTSFISFIDAGKLFGLWKDHRATFRYRLDHQAKCEWNSFESCPKSWLIPHALQHSTAPETPRWATVKLRFPEPERRL